MICEVCKHDYDGSDTALRFCAHCGWPLGRLAVQIEPVRVTLGSPHKVNAALILQNKGKGRLACGIESLPTGVRLAPGFDRPYDLVTDPVQVGLEIDSQAIGRTVSELSIIVWVDDVHGRSLRHYRQASLDVVRRRETATLKFQRVQFGPVHLFQEMLIFRERREQVLRMQNLGQLQVTVTVTASDGYRIHLPGKPLADSLRFELLGKPTMEEILVEPPPLGTLTPNKEAVSSLHVTFENLPDSDREVTLLWLPAEQRKAQTEQWILGIDFGTYKSAIFYTDCFKARKQPECVPWQIPNTNQTALKAPSVIMYPQRGLPLFGWEVPATAELNPNNVVIRSIKKRLTDDTDYLLPNGQAIPPSRLVEHYIGFLLEHIREQDVFDGDPFSRSKVVFSLPVHDDADKYDKQKDRTIQAAIAAGLNAEQIVCYPEPECAAVEFLRRRLELGMTVQDGDLMCVFDCGAGTTDICVLEVHLQGEISFTRKALVGFPIGGDVIDELLTVHVLKELDKRKLLSDMAPNGATFKIGKEANATSRRSFVTQIRQLKEKLKFPDSLKAKTPTAGVIYAHAEIPTGDPIEITWELIETLFLPFVDKMLNAGFQANDVIPDWSLSNPQGRAVETELPSLRQALSDKQIKQRSMQWICLTGGSSFIPFLVRMLEEMLRPAKLIPVPDRIPATYNDPTVPFTLNVAAGAAMRPLFLVGGLLPFDLSLELRCGGDRERQMTPLTRGSTPGKRVPPKHFFLPVEEGQLCLMAHNSHAEQAIYVFPVNNRNAAQGMELLAYVRYDTDMKISLSIARSDESGETTLLPWTEVLK